MIVNRQHRVRVSVRELERFLTRARRALGIPADTLTICLVENAQIARWNQAYRGKNGPTDVLSFPADGAPPMQTKRTGRRRISSRKRLRPSRSQAFPAISNHYLGDIAIAPAIARQNSRRFGRTFSAEMRILILHGILHLMGYDHETDEGRMDRRERRLRRQMGLG
jgi:probable rRNA maturation factor